MVDPIRGKDSPEIRNAELRAREQARQDELKRQELCQKEAGDRKQADRTLKIQEKDREYQAWKNHELKNLEEGSGFWSSANAAVANADPEDAMQVRDRLFEGYQSSQRIDTKEAPDYLYSYREFLSYEENNRRQFSNNQAASSEKTTDDKPTYTHKKAHHHLRPFKVIPGFSMGDLVNLGLQGESMRKRLQGLPQELSNAESRAENFSVKTLNTFRSNICDQMIIDSPLPQGRIAKLLAPSRDDKEEACKEIGMAGYEAAQKYGTDPEYPNVEYAKLGDYTYDDRLLLRHQQSGNLASFVLDQYFRELQQKDLTSTLSPNEEKDYRFLKAKFFSSSEDQKFKVNLYGEGEGKEYGLVDFAIESRYAEGFYSHRQRPLTSSLPKQSADQIVVRRLSGDDGKDLLQAVLPELERLAKPGTELIIISPLFHRPGGSVGPTFYLEEKSGNLVPVGKIFADQKRNAFLELEASGFRHVRSDAYPVGRDPTFLGFSDESHQWHVFVYDPSIKKPVPESSPTPSPK